MMLSSSQEAGQEVQGPLRKYKRVRALFRQGRQVLFIDAGMLREFKLEGVLTWMERKRAWALSAPELEDAIARTPTFVVWVPPARYPEDRKLVRTHLQSLRRSGAVAVEPEPGSPAFEELKRQFRHARAERSGRRGASPRGQAPSPALPLRERLAPYAGPDAPVLTRTQREQMRHFMNREGRGRFGVDMD